MVRRDLLGEKRQRGTSERTTLIERRRVLRARTGTKVAADI
jgi:hypothetical protein